MQSVSARCHATSSHMTGNCGAQKLLVPIAAQQPVFAASCTPTAQSSFIHAQSSPHSL